MISQPLFGQDSSPHRTSKYVSLMATAGVWTVLLLCFALIPVRTKVTKYKPVQIILDSVPLPPVENPANPVEAEETQTADSTDTEMAVEEIQEAVVEQPAPVPVIEQAVEIPEVEAPVQQPEQKVEAPAPAEPKKTEVKPVDKPVVKPVEKPAESKTVKTETPVVTKEPAAPLYELQKSVDDQLNFSSTKKSAADYDDIFAAMDSSNANTSSASTSTKVNKESTTAGSSGKVTQTETKNTSASTKPAEAKTSDSTSEMLKNISKLPSKTYTSKKATNNSSSTTMSSKNIADGIQVEMQGGKLRTLLEPMTTAIPISDDAGKTITEDKEVVITFTVGKNGDVPRSEIKITPSAILSSKVIEEILNTMTTWRFEASDSTSTGSFTFTIIKK